MNDDTLRAQLRGLPVLDTELSPFDTDEVPDHPAELFRDWLRQAIDAGVREPHAMTLSTVDTAGHPNSRVLILKGLAGGHWQFATSGESRKGQELARTPGAAASFYWPEVGRQARIRGRVLDGGAEAAARDFLARPDGSRAESLVGNQSQILQDPADLDAALEEARARLAAHPDLIPEHWRLYHLVPDDVEFWQADHGRRHIRLRYELHADGWTRQLLWP